MSSRVKKIVILLSFCTNVCLLSYLLVFKNFEGGKISKLRETRNLQVVNEQLQIYKKASANESEHCKQLNAENKRLKSVVVERLRLMNERRREIANKSEQYNQLEIDYARLKREVAEKLQLLSGKQREMVNKSEQLQGEIKRLKKSKDDKLQLLEEKQKENKNKSELNKQLEAENKQLKGTLDELKRKMDDNITRSEIRSEQRFMTFNLARPQENSNTLLKLIKDFTDNVTIILYSDAANFSLECIQAKQKSIQKKFPRLKVIAPENTQLSSASVFNFYFPLVKTKYFLFLDSSVELADPRSDHSVSWLLYALENIPELDFISGSILKADRHLEVPCYRLLLCNWTLSQKYEYKRSVGEVMICENIASSFMGKTNSVRVLFGENNSPFDSNLPAMPTTDFFLRAKQNGGTAGVLPDVMYTQSGSCHTNLPRNDKEKFKELLPFAEKHKVFRFKDADSKVLDLCANDSPIAGESICDEKIAHKVMLAGGHWVDKGTFAYPFMLNNLQYGMATVLKCLESENITFFVGGGASLGALKFRGILPWDAGDVDIYVYDKNQTELYDIVKQYFSSNSEYTISKYPSSDQVQVFCTPAKIGKKMGGLMSLFPLNKPSPDPSEFIKMNANGKWIPCEKSVFKSFRTDYGTNYLQHRTWINNEVAGCTLPGHNACLPNFQTLNGLQGTAGTFKEYFCDL